MEKNIRVSNHALIRATQRGATNQEISSCIHTGKWSPLPSGKYSAQTTFAFNDRSPVNGKRYDFKSI
jgi:hypothetical protein